MYYKQVSVFEFQRGMELVLLVGLLCTVLPVVNGVDFDPAPQNWTQGQYGSFSCSNPVAVTVNKNGNEVTMCFTDGKLFCPTPAPSYTKVTVRGNTLNFTILNVSRTRDTANWECGGTTTYIDVKVPLPSATIENKNSLTFNDGQTTSITSKTGVSYPPANITWSIGGTNINGGTTTNNPEGTTTSILQYTPDKTDHNKILQCSATNGFGSTQSDSMTLNIRYVPTVKSNPTGTVNVIEGKELKLTCVVVDANPPVTSYTWSKDGAVISGEQKPTFIISSVQKSDDGSYTCAATNSVGTGQNSETVEVKVRVDVSVQAVSCPTSRNQPVNITRVTDMVFVSWYKNNNDGITNALYNSTTGGCHRPSNNKGHTIYCEKSDNNNYRFTLQVHQPTEGDVYYINSKLNDKTTIIFQDPVNIEPELKDNITLTNDRKTQLKTSITCTPLTPVFTWIIKFQNGAKTTITGSTTTDRTGCDVTETTLTSTVTISKDTVKIINDPFTVSVQLSYKECDNIYTSQPTPYFTIKNVSGVHESDSDPVPPPYMYIGIGVGGAVLLLIIIVVILCCCWKRKEKKDMDTGSHPGPKLNMASFSREVSGTTTSGVDEPSSPSQYEGLNPVTRDNKALTYQQLTNNASGTTTSGVDEPSHYGGLNSETRENTAPTYQQLLVYQN